MELEKSTLAHRHSVDFMKPIGKEGRSVVMARLDEASQTPLQPLSNPALATKRGRPAGSTKRKAIQREKSLFEHATGRKCSRCGQAAHNSRTCNVQTSEQQ
ncbi:hypothetical protein BASA60_010793 [Batrachochytrium salamandrivorans]|nr:hypothetical protein BASA60_010793 [Batrachochytrium salamandrivorans]